MVPADLVPSGLLLASFFLCHHMVKEREREIEARTEEKREGGKQRERGRMDMRELPSLFLFLPGH